jgi:hypothetical protein
LTREDLICVGTDSINHRAHLSAEIHPACSYPGLACVGVEASPLMCSCGDQQCRPISFALPTPLNSTSKNHLPKFENEFDNGHWLLSYHSDILNLLYRLSFGTMMYPVSMQPSCHLLIYQTNRGLHVSFRHSTLLAHSSC